jgi:hypothetical protein
VRRPAIRTEQYRSTIADFRAARVVSSTLDTESSKQRLWQETLTTADGKRAVVSGRDHMDVIHVQYADELKPRDACKYQDYTNVIDVRVRGQTLYVYRAVTLIWTEYRLAVYDLSKRSIQDDWLIAPEDMPDETRSK